MEWQNFGAETALLYRVLLGNYKSFGQTWDTRATMAHILMTQHWDTTQSFIYIFFLRILSQSYVHKTICDIPSFPVRYQSKVGIFAKPYKYSISKGTLMILQQPVLNEATLSIMVHVTHLPIVFRKWPREKIQPLALSLDIVFDGYYLNTLTQCILYAGQTGECWQYVPGQTLFQWFLASEMRT